MDPLSRHFWSGCETGEIRCQSCAACGAAQFYPRPFCLRCGAAAPGWVASAGRGTIAAITIVERAPNETFRALTPYAVALVDLDEGFRMMAHAETELAIGDRVRARFRRLGERALPYFVRETED